MGGGHIEQVVLYQVHKGGNTDLQADKQVTERQTGYRQTNRLQADKQVTDRQTDKQVTGRQTG